MMRKVFVLGETVWDLIFKNGIPIAAKAGGSMLNVAVTLGRLDSNVSFISELGDDQAGKYILKFLIENNVETDSMNQYENYKTSIALAFLNEKGKADYSFYKYLPKQRLRNFPEKIDKGDILMFGSYFAINEDVRLPLNSFISRFNKEDHCIIYDPNFRPSHMFELQHMIPMIEENIYRSSIVRCSDEDMELIYAINHPEDAYRKIKSLGCNTMIYTHSNQFVYFRNSKHTIKINVPKIETISTIGAGDSFNAALLNKILHFHQFDKSIDDLEKDEWEEILYFAVEVSQKVCQSLENYLPLNN